VIDLRATVFVIGVLLAALAAVMAVPALVDQIWGRLDDAQVFAASAVITLFFGISLVLAARVREISLDVRQTFVTASLAWLVVAAFSALPFVLSQANLRVVDAFFEAMSGLTTTGSTVLSGLDNAPPGLLLWRALLQWLGGYGAIALATMILPALQVGGMQLFRVETSRAAERALPRVTQIMTGVGIIYVGLTAVFATILWLLGMTGLEGVVHAMTSISTGGFSTSDESIAHFHSAGIEVTLTVAMLIGGLPFVVILQAVRGNPRRLMRDQQVHWFLGVVVLAMTAMTGWEYASTQAPFLAALRESAFNTVSILTGSGFLTSGYTTWGGLAAVALFFFMIVGGCAGSTTGGIKIFRFQVMYETAQAEVNRLIEPRGVFIPYFNDKPIPDEVSDSVMGFFFLFAVSFGVLALALGLMGLDLVTSLSAAATALANVGPGMGSVIGPGKTFAALPDAAKWLLSFGMLIGRLEIYTVLVLLAPAFWRA
jgi:trk system potassium uptake protein TrkH